MGCVTWLYNYALLQTFHCITITLHIKREVLMMCMWLWPTAFTSTSTLLHTFSCVWNSLDIINNRSDKSSNIDTCLVGTTVEAYHNPPTIVLPQYWATRGSSIWSGHMPYVRACGRECVQGTILRLQFCGADAIACMMLNGIICDWLAYLSVCEAMQNLCIWYIYTPLGSAQCTAGHSHAGPHPSSPFSLPLPVTMVWVLLSANSSAGHPCLPLQQCSQIFSPNHQPVDIVYQYNEKHSYKFILLYIDSLYCME